MRRILVITVLCLAGVGGVTGCGADSPTTPTPSASADETDDVCVDALAVETKGEADVLAKVDAITKPVPGQSVPVAQSQLLTIVDGWKSTLSELSHRPAKSAVTTALQSTIGYLDGLKVNALAADEIRTKLTELHNELVAACG